MDVDLRENIILEYGYGDKFGIADSFLAEHVAKFPTRDEILTGTRRRPPAQAAARGRRCAEDRPGAVGLAALCAGRRADPARDRPAATLIAFEAMNHWTRDGRFALHVFHKNNELAGYCSVLHALELAGPTATTAPTDRGRDRVRRDRAGRRHRADAHGVHDVDVLTIAPSPRSARRSTRRGSCSSTTTRTAPHPATCSPSEAGCRWRRTWRSRRHRQLHAAGHRRARRRSSGPRTSTRSRRAA